MTTPDARNCRRMQPMAGLLRTAGVDWQLFRAEVRAALDSWQAVAGVTFELVDDASRADILIGAQIKPRGRAYANVAFEPAAATGIGPLTRSFVCLNPEQPWKIGFDGRLDIYDLRYTIQHEIGHAIGLNHPSASGQLMSYRYEELFRGPQSGDIDGARLLYGPPRN